MNDNISVVEQDPPRRGIAFDPETHLATLLHRVFDGVGRGVHLAAACPGDEDEEIDQGRQLMQVENDDVAPAVFFGRLGTKASSLPGLLDR
jgi:hypothetical protein